jgi:hypothetical protein
MKKKYLFIGLSILMLNLIGCGESDKVNNDKNASMLFAIYLTGSDLESRGNAGTNDLLELVKGYNQLSKVEQDNINVQVIFGGANKTGWEGIKYANIDCIVEDAKDKEFGNDSCYEKENISADMGNPETLTNFLTYLDKLGNYDTRMLTFWNHGGAYKGVCWDEKSHNQLTLNELQEVFQSLNSSFDIIGMDACLMANYSVAETLKKYAHYLLASEELEPGHGWQYTDVIKAIGQQEDKDAVAIGTKIIDSFIDNNEHNQTDKKTLSLINLNKINNVTTAFDTFNESVVYSEQKNFQSTVNSISFSKGYANSNEGSLSQDFKSFMNELSSRLVDKNDSIQLINKAINECVVYNRYQEGMEGSHGLSIANPFYDELNNKVANDSVKYREIKELSDVWKKTVNEFVGIQKKDTQKPIISNFEKDCIDEGEKGTCMDIFDDTSINAIHYNIFLNSGNDSYLKIEEMSFLETLENGNYFFPNQENKAYMLCGEEEGCNFFPVRFIREGIWNGQEYNAFAIEVQLNNLPARLLVYADKNDTFLDADVALYTEPGLLSRPEALKDKDIIKYQMDFYNLDGTKKDNNITVDNEITGQELKKLFSYQDISMFGKDMKVEINIALKDINNNITYSPIF